MLVQFNNNIPEDAALEVSHEAINTRSTNAAVTLASIEHFMTLGPATRRRLAQNAKRRIEACHATKKVLSKS